VEARNRGVEGEVEGEGSWHSGKFQPTPISLYTLPSPLSGVPKLGPHLSPPSKRTKLTSHAFDSFRQILHDEITTLNLELNHTTARNEALKKDNASLLQRWIDKMNDEVEQLNLANGESVAVSRRISLSPLLYLRFDSGPTHTGIILFFVRLPQQPRSSSDFQ